MRPLHVLHVADAGIFDRFGRMFRHLVLALSAEGLRLSLLTDDAEAVAALDGLPVNRHFQPAFSGWRAARRVRRLLGEIELPDVVHVWGASGLDLIGGWALSHNCPVLVHLLSVADVEAVTRARWCEEVRLLPGCRGLRRLLPSFLPLRIEEAWDFSPALLMPEELELVPLPQDRLPGVVWVGRVERSAELETLIAAVAELRRREVAVQVALIGAGPACGQVRAQIRALGVRDRVSLVEEPHLWEQAVGGAEVCVIPARQDELYLAPLLAMALGKVVVASTDQLAEWFIADQTCWQFPPGDAAGLADCVVRLIAEPAIAQRLRCSAAAYVRENHRIGRLSESLAEAYRRVCARRRHSQAGDRRAP